MKRYLGSLFATVFLIFTSYAYSTVNIKTGVNISWSDNVFNLSDSDKEKFEEGNNKFDFIETSDDLKPEIYFDAEYKFDKKSPFRCFSPFGGISYVAYAKNTDKSKFSSDIGLKWEKRKLSLAVSYAYNPKIYTRNYIDKDGSGKSEKYEYEKNIYDFKCEYRILKNDYLIGGINFQQEYYNKYFTEYDGNALTYKIGWKHSFPLLYLKFIYNLKVFDCDKFDEKFAAENNIDNQKDSSYESNKYVVALRMKKIKTGSFLQIRPVLSCSFDQRFYQTDNLDIIHREREDNKVTTNISNTFYLSGKLSCKVFYKNVYRKTDSDFYEDISDIKDYSENEIGINFEYKMKL
ncbi:MAG: hypothetical protein CSB55_02670 [Candidatus Cloacimonadota bacterium]|nr:MAG: hypothetical protein CSB55_02670 [Candidatus Cloacimonadota bacterium]